MVEPFRRLPLETVETILAYAAPTPLDLDRLRLVDRRFLALCDGVGLRQDALSAQARSEVARSEGADTYGANYRRSVGQLRVRTTDGWTCVPCPAKAWAVRQLYLLSQTADARYQDYLASLRLQVAWGEPEPCPNAFAQLRLDAQGTLRTWAHDTTGVALMRLNLFFSGRFSRGLASDEADWKAALADDFALQRALLHVDPYAWFRLTPPLRREPSFAAIFRTSPALARPALPIDSAPWREDARAYAYLPARLQQRTEVQQAYLRQQADELGDRSMDPATQVAAQSRDAAHRRAVRQWRRAYPAVAYVLHPAPVELPVDAWTASVTRAFVRARLQESGLYLRFFGSPVRRDAALVAFAVQHNGLALAFSDPALQDDEATVRLAVAQNGLALAYASLRLRGHAGVVTIAAAQDPMALEYAPATLRAWPALAAAARIWRTGVTLLRSAHYGAMQLEATRSAGCAWSAQLFPRAKTADVRDAYPVFAALDEAHVFEELLPAWSAGLCHRAHLLSGWNLATLAAAAYPPPLEPPWMPFERPSPFQISPRTLSTYLFRGEMTRLLGAQG